MKSTNLIPCPSMTHTQCWQETPWIETCNCTLHWGECVHVCVHRVYLTFMHTRIFTSLACPAHLLLISLSLCSFACKPNRIYRRSFMWFYRKGIYFISSRPSAPSLLFFGFGLDYFHLTWHFIFMIWLLRCLWAFLRLECDIWFSFCVQLLLLFDIFLFAW